MKRVLLEVCCGSADDVIEAHKAGADRVELNSDLFHGGLTPTLGELIVAKRETGMKIMAMVRPREGGFCYTDAEFATAVEDARLLLTHGADGLVFGFLHEDGTVDKERVKAMLEVIGDHESVFHRAIDVTPDWKAAMDVLMELGVTRILTSGQKPSVPEGIFTIKEMMEYAAGRIQVLPGAGITPENARWVRQITGTTMMHAALSRTIYDRSAMGNPSIYFGGCVYPPEDRYNETLAEDVANFVTCANR